MAIIEDRFHIPLNLSKIVGISVSEVTAMRTTALKKRLIFEQTGE